MKSLFNFFAWNLDNSCYSIVSNVTGIGGFPNMWYQVEESVEFPLLYFADLNRLMVTITCESRKRLSKK
jgi:hypothetical protein